jgi:hypothetical protein
MTALSLASGNSVNGVRFLYRYSEEGEMETGILLPCALAVLALGKGEERIQLQLEEIPQMVHLVRNGMFGRQGQRSG